MCIRDRSYTSYEQTIANLLNDVDSQLKIIKNSGVVPKKKYEEYATALSDWETICSSIVNEIKSGQKEKGTEDILTKWNEKFAALDPNNETTYTYAEYYRSMVTALGAKGNTWQSMVDNQQKLTESVEDKRQQVMGVSSEEEMVDLLKYQHAYNAASRYISVIDAMLEHLIERLG